jgi:hypothetical protein
MNDSIFTLDDLLKRLGATVADAMAPLNLDALSPGDRDAFTRGVTGRTVNTFWKTYVEALPSNVQAPMRAALARDDKEALTAWHVQYANFMEDEHARALAESIFDAMSRELPKQVKNDYAAFAYVAEFA